MRSFLGLIGFCCTFIPQFAQVAATLTDATNKGQPNEVNRTQALENVFEGRVLGVYALMPSDKRIKENLADN